MKVRLHTERNTNRVRIGDLTKAKERQWRKEVKANKEFLEAPALWGIRMKLNIQKWANELMKETDTPNNIGHLRLVFCLSFKTSLNAKRFIHVYEK